MTAAPPPEIAHFVEALGERATLLLLEHHAGTRLYVASGERGVEGLARKIGAEAARALAEMCGNDRIPVPLAKAWRARIYRADGMSHSQIARRLGCTEKQVQRYFSAAASGTSPPGAAPKASAQLSLPLGSPPAGA